MESNQIEVVKMTSKYCDFEHECIVIDGIPLDIYLHRLYPENNFEGLVPTIVDWVSHEKDSAFVLSRHRSSKAFVRLPLLMCPDDCDVWCTLLIADVERDGTTVYWHRIGIDQTTAEEITADYELIGNRVEWLNKAAAMSFSQKKYDAEMQKLWCQ